MNRARTAMLIGLAFVVVAFTATWLTVPAAGKEPSPPASLFARGLTSETCTEYRGGYSGSDPPRCVRFGDPEVVRAQDLDDLRLRIAVAFGAAAVVVVLLGLAFGAGRRSIAA